MITPICLISEIALRLTVGQKLIIQPAEKPFCEQAPVSYEIQEPN
jgi:hypothetical protein